VLQKPNRQLGVPQGDHGKQCEQAGRYAQDGLLRATPIGIGLKRLTNCKRPRRRAAKRQFVGAKAAISLPGVKCLWLSSAGAFEIYCPRERPCSGIKGRVKSPSSDKASRFCFEQLGITSLKKGRIRVKGHSGSPDFSFSAIPKRHV
jgi:hypothetical protein